MLGKTQRHGRTRRVTAAALAAAAVLSCAAVATPEALGDWRCLCGDNTVAFHLKVPAHQMGVSLTVGAEPLQTTK